MEGYHKTDNFYELADKAVERINNPTSATKTISGFEDVKHLSQTDRIFALNQLNNIIAKYTSRTDLTSEEQLQVLALNTLVEDLQSAQQLFTNQENQTGAVDSIYNSLKEFFGKGISDVDITEALNKQETMIQELTDAINKGDNSFKDIWQKWTGNTYN